MGIWDFISSTGDSLKRNTPDPVKRACSASYAYGSVAASKIGDACGAVDIRRLNPVRCVPDDETRKKIVVFSTKFAENAARYAIDEFCKSFTGVKAITAIYSQTLRDVESRDRKGQKDRVLKQVSGSSSEETDPSGHEKSLDVDPFELRKPEGELRTFIPVKELVSSRFFNELIIQDILSQASKDSTTPK